MNYKTYCPCDSDFSSHYKTQAGAGLDDIEVFKGQPYQRGYGIGSFLKRIGIPILKSLFRTGLDIGQDVLDNQNLKNSLKTRGREGLKTAAKSGLTELVNAIDQIGTGIRKRRKIKKVKRLSSKHSANKKSSAKRKRTSQKKKFTDIFQ